MTALSVNLNKIAWLRNARGALAEPDLLAMAALTLEAGAQGITVHPRPDRRHITPEDVDRLSVWLNSQPAEFNLEGNPFSERGQGYPGFLDLVEQTQPNQCTLVPDASHQLTSDHGFTAEQIKKDLPPVIKRLKNSDIRISLFADPVAEVISAAAAIGVDRVELYTGPYASAFQADIAHCGRPNATTQAIHKSLAEAAKIAVDLGLDVNAGHGLNIANLGYFLSIQDIMEVSIGHALTTEALKDGWAQTVKKYLAVIQQAS